MYDVVKNTNPKWLKRLEEINPNKGRPNQIATDYTPLVYEDVFSMSLISSTVVVSYNAMLTYEDFFNQATIYWMNTNSPKNEMWSWVNAWFIDVYTKIINENWFNDESKTIWKSYKDYVNKYINDNKNALDPSTQFETFTLKDYHYNNTNLDDNFWLAYSKSQYITAICFSKYLPDPESYDFSNKPKSNEYDDDYNKIFFNPSVNNDFKIPLKVINKWMYKCSNEAIEKYNNLMSYRKYKNFNELDNYLSQYTNTSNRDTSENNYNPGSNIALKVSVHSFALWNNISDIDEKNIQDTFLSIFNIINKFIIKSKTNYLDLLYSIVIEKNLQKFSTTGFNRVLSEWSGYNGETNKVAYYSNNSLFLIIDGYYLMPKTDYNQLFNTLDYASNMQYGEIYKILASTLCASAGVSKSFNTSQRAIYKNSVGKNKSYTPNFVFKNSMLYGYNNLGPYKNLNINNKYTTIIIVVISVSAFSLSILLALIVYFSIRRKEIKK
ncbi:hypothetical protein [Spiroplasma endosymbiont of Aspidapion aeneum]|uniref:hypothetical protein n=1 Tax=Spiroplasma endosymbiont of Aspidapion aeneum TaxID=3066276 RepID=UPI00313F0FAE